MWAECLVVVLCLSTAISSLAAGNQVLRGHIPKQAAPARYVERLPGTNRLDLSVVLPLRNRQALTKLLSELYDPASPQYRHYLTPQLFAEQFGPTKADYEKLIEFANVNRLTITRRHSNRTLLTVNGSVADIERTLRVHLGLYQHPSEPRRFRAPDRDPSLDLDLPVLAIDGLDDAVVPRPMSLKKAALGRSGRASPLVAGSGPGGSLLGGDFRAAYAPGVELDGAGQAVGLFEMDGYYLSDITQYESLAGLPNVPLRNVLVGGFNGRPGANNVEVALDIAMVICLAPGLSEVIVYEGRNANEVLNQMATDNQARQLSSSWSFGQQVDPVREQIYQQFAAQGQSMFQASGDAGAYAGPAAAPADDPFVTAVGGTVLTTSGPAGAWVSESAWSGSGGGISTVVALPAWQRGVANSTNQGSSSLRNVPDVACVANDIWLVGDNGEHFLAGGTSAAAPLWAGFAALVNQQATASGKPSVGFLNPALYAIGQSASFASGFHDVTTGNTTNTSSPERFFSVPGYDLCTGWGTPGGKSLINALLASPDPLRIAPESSLMATGPTNGPFSPTASSLWLTNMGSAPLNWTFRNSAPWLDVAPANGTLAPGAPPVSLSLSPNAAARSLSAGSYVTTLWLTNLSSGVGQSRQFILGVVTQPLITAQPTDQEVLEGMTAAFSVQTSTNGLLFFQWQRDSGAGRINLSDGGNLFGCFTGTLTLSNATAADVGTYSVIVSNIAGWVLSSNAFLTVKASPPVITFQPASQSALPGQTVRCSAGAVGTSPLNYHWRRNGTNLSDLGNYSGVSTPSLVISNVSALETGMYTVAISNAIGSNISAAAELNVVSVTAPQITMATLYWFGGGDGGGNPNALLEGSRGIFYGTTQNGGFGSAGTIFRISSAGDFSRLYSFGGGNDGANPYAPLARGIDGNFYGTTYQGGTSDYGSIFRISGGGSFATVASLGRGNGVLPFAGLAADGYGNLYGTGYEGGTNHLGTVFKVAPDGSLTTVYAFSGIADGSFPYAGLVFGLDGDLYGTTTKGGEYSAGTTYKVSTNGVFTTLVAFGRTNGAFPYAGLVLSSDGNFYGTTANGGDADAGVIFRMTPAGEFTRLYSFSGNADGARPTASLTEGSDGNLYGTTTYGGAYNDGTVFRITPSGTLVTLVNFEGYNGAHPRAPLTQGADGDMYGVTQDGGAGGQGTIFRLSVTSPPVVTSEPVSQSVFQGAAVRLSVSVSGRPPLTFQWRKNGVALTDGGNVLGSATHTLMLSNVSVGDSGAYSVVITNTLGVVTSVDAFLQVTSSAPILVQQPTNQVSAPGQSVRFTVVAQGDLPLSYRWLRDGTGLSDSENLQGSAGSTLTLSKVTEADSGVYSVRVSNALGTVTSLGAALEVIPVSAAGTRLATLHWFTGGTDGDTPSALRQAADGMLYGTTALGGDHQLGTIFRLDHSGRLETLLSFSGTNGSLPGAGLVQGTNGDLYGTTERGGTRDQGTVFRMSPSGVFTSIHSFTGEEEGGNPAAALIQASDGSLYGTTEAGGAGFGTVYRLRPEGTVTPICVFTNGVDGGKPAGELVEADDGNFYGLTTGGSLGFGTAFRLTPAGSLRTVYSFANGADGSAPAGALVQAADGNFYGATKHNTIQGYAFYGTLFRMSPNGALTTLYSLNFNDGFFPYAGLLQASDGNFYGTTYTDRFGGYGTLFRMSPGGALTTLVWFDGLDTGSRPQTALMEGADGSLYGSTSADGPGGHGTIFRLSMTGAPQITSQPGNQVATPGASVMFSVASFGAPPLSYQWQRNGTNLTDSGNVSGSNGRVLRLAEVAPADGGSYSVRISNASSSVTSASAVLNVLFSPEFGPVAQANGTITLSWSAMLGQRYRLQYKPNLSTSTWTSLGGYILATNTVMSATDVIGTNSLRFYRVVLVP